MDLAFLSQSGFLSFPPILRRFFVQGSANKENHPNLDRINHPVKNSSRHNALCIDPKNDFAPFSTWPGLACFGEKTFGFPKRCSNETKTQSCCGLKKQLLALQGQALLHGFSFEKLP